MYLVFTTNWGHKNKNYLQIRNNNNNNVYTIKICGMYTLYNKTIVIRKVVFNPLNIDISFQLEQEFSAKAEKLKANEREKLHLLSNQKQVRF